MYSTGSLYKAGYKKSTAHTGAVTLIQRFGSALNPNIHFHRFTGARCEVIKMQLVTGKALPWPPEPFRWMAVKLTQLALIRADKKGGTRGLWLKFLDALGLGFTC